MVSLLFFLFFFPLQSLCQQPYIGNQTNCSMNDTSTSKGYICTDSIFSCQSYLIFRSDSLLSYDLYLLNFTLGNNTLFRTTADCGCWGLYYHYIAYYTIKKGDSYEKIANDIFQGFTSCSVLRSVSLDYAIDNTSSVGRRLQVPLRCACPTKAQKAKGVEFLAVYMLQPNESIGSVARDFGVEEEGILEANMLSMSSQTFPFTPILVPLNKNVTCRIDPSSYYDCNAIPPPTSNDNDYILYIVLIAIGTSLFSKFDCVYKLLSLLSLLFSMKKSTLWKEYYQTSQLKHIKYSWNKESSKISHITITRNLMNRDLGFNWMKLKFYG